jgi:lambda family phage portal protein
MNLFGLEIKRSRRWSGAKFVGKATPAYPSAQTTRLNADFPILNLSADAAIRGNLRELRARSQALEREKGGIVERYLSCVETNVIGPDGIGLQIKVKDSNGNLDRSTSERIEEAWSEFCGRGQFDITGEHSSQNFDRLSVRASARDGDVLQLVYRSAPNKAGIAFQILEGQHLDDWHNQPPAPAGSGNEIRMGVEVDRFRRKLAFWVLSAHPGDFYGYQYDSRRVRIPAYGVEPDAPVQAIHVTRTKRPEETRAVPWVTPAIDPINMLAGYEEAELVAARAQACKHVFFERAAFAPDGTPLEYNEASTGQLTDEIEPGGATETPIGYHANFYNPTHPNQAFADFTKDFRRKISAALNCAYNTLFTDLEGVNYSSIRAGLLDERDQWKMTQNWYISTAKQIQFEAWLEMQLLLGKFPGLTLSDFDRIRYAAIWKPRRWPWVDPLHDIQAAAAAIEAKLTTRTRVIADQTNEDFEETIDELAEETVYILAQGLDPALTEAPRLANPTFPATGTQADGSGADSGAPAATAEPPARQHHSARQARDPGGRFGRMQV